MKYACMLATVLLLLLCGTVYAERTVWYVHPDSALNTIQAGLDSCADNDIVLVGPGTYVESIVWPNMQGIHLISELGPQLTIIDGNSADIVILITTYMDTTTFVSGFTIQNGSFGIMMGDGTPRIHNNVIKDNAWDGIHNPHGAPVLEGNTISNNGTGLTTHGGWFELVDNDISYNYGSGLVFSTAPSDCMYSRQGINGNIFSHNGGYGINLYSGSLKNSTITYNGAGGILACTGADFDSCTIAHNYGPGVANFEGPCIAHRGRQGSHINYCDIFDNVNYGILNQDTVLLNAENNWWGDATGPYHPTGNPGGLGDTVNGYVDFDPWLSWPVGVEERPIVKPVETNKNLGATIFRGSLQLPAGKTCRVFDITGRVVEPSNISRGIYFIEIEGKVVQKTIKIR